MAKTQLFYTIEILEETDKKIIDLYRGMYPATPYITASGGNEELMDFVRDDIDKLIIKLVNKKWYDDMGRLL